MPAESMMPPGNSLLPPPTLEHIRVTYGVKVLKAVLGIRTFPRDLKRMIPIAQVSAPGAKEVGT